MDEYLGKISFFGFDWIPQYYESCSGQLIQISTNTSLFSLLMTNFGGNGTTNFQLPDLRGRVIMGQDSSSFRMGSQGGSTTTTLSVNHLPKHNHSAELNASATIKVSTEVATIEVPSARDNTLAYITQSKMYNDATPDVSLNIGKDAITGTVDIQNTGEGASFTNLPPYLVLNPCIVVQGIYPSRK